MLVHGGNGFAGMAIWTLQTEHTRLQGKAPGATAHEYSRNLAVARLALDNITNIGVTRPALGFKVGQVGLFYGANDFGSTMMEENVVSAAAWSDRVRVTDASSCATSATQAFLPQPSELEVQDHWLAHAKLESLKRQAVRIVTLTTRPRLVIT